MLKKMTATILAASMAFGGCVNAFASENKEIKKYIKASTAAVNNEITTTAVSESTTMKPLSGESTTDITAAAEVSTEAAAEESTEAAEVSTEAAAEESTEAAEVSTEAAAEESTEAAEVSTEAAAEESTEAAAEVSTEAAAEKATEITTEKAAEATTNETEEMEIITMADDETEVSTVKEVVTETTTRRRYSSSSDDTFSINEDRTLNMNSNETIDLSRYVSNLIDVKDYQWNCSNSKIVKLTDEGRITALKAGSASVTAYYYDGNYYFQYIFTIKVDSDDVTEEKQFTIRADAQKDLSSFISKIAAPEDYSWSSDNKTVAVVSKDGVVTGKKKGTAKINARYHVGKREYNYVFRINVEDAKSSGSSATSTVVNKTTWSIYLPTKGGIYLEDFLSRDYGDYKWNVDDESIVDFKNGKVTGKKKGSTTMTAVLGSLTNTFNIYVNDNYETVLANIKVKNSINIKNCLNGGLDDYEIYSDRDSVASIDEKGNVTGNAAGMATIIAKGGRGSIIQIICNVSNTGETKLKTKMTAEGKRDIAKDTSAKEANIIKADEKEEESASSFSDIAHRTWAVASIENMSKKGYIVGTGDGRFEPDGTTKRADFTIVLVKMFGLEGQSSELYADIAGNEYYADYVSTAKNNGIEGGVSENCFRPKEAITREEIFVMIYKAMKQKGIEMNTDTSVLNKYSDNSWMNDENREAIAALVNNGIVVGTGDELEITAYITRAQMAVLLDKVDDYI